ncbi:MAG: hypothetical protein JRJ03_05010 [Deltaproteobacteria bacterium]|nr:hypothetical protein [Deltaproteobacteria bacterium]
MDRIKNLYVYVIKGRIRELEENGLGESFIGNWVEDDSYSFLFFSAPSRDKVTGLMRPGVGTWK